MKSFIEKNWSLFIGLIVLWLTIVTLLMMSIQRNQGHFGYALDDAYIHMAIAKNISQHGVWGVTKYEFSSASSSILWSLILSGTYYIFGVNEINPLILNIIFSTLLVLLVYTLMKYGKRKVNQKYIFLTILGIIFLTPLPALMFGGMEHVLQTLITIGVIYLSAKLLAKSNGNFSSVTIDSILLLLLAPLATLVRYESLFLVFILCLLFGIRKRWLYALILGAFAIIPIGIFGIISVAQSSFWLPNSVLLKGNSPDITSIEGIFKIFGGSALLKLATSLHVFFLLLVSIAVFILRFDKQKGFWKEGQIMITIFVFYTLLHMTFADVGWFYRYEAYLVALGLFVIATTVFEYLPKGRGKINDIDKNLIPKYAVIAILCIIQFSPLVSRGAVALQQIPQATKNVYEQQYQMGLFLKKFYQGATVAANDIGAISYLGDIKCLDLVGLGTIEVAKMRREGSYDREKIYKLTNLKDVKIAIVYDDWFQIPSQWIKIGEWKIKNNVICGDDTVSFYAVKSSEKESLIANLKQFASMLPKDVEQSGKYT